MLSIKFRFAFVSNSAEVASTLVACADPAQEMIETHLSSLEEALPVARKLLAQGVEVIIGGGATGQLLRKQLGRPVVTIVRSHLDVLQALVQAREKFDEVGLTSYEAPPEGVDLYEKLLSIRIHPLMFSSMSELVENISHLAAQGVGCIVGSAMSKEVAASLGIKGIVIYPTQPAVYKALEDARILAIEQRLKRADVEHMRILLQSISDGVICMDSEGRITLINTNAAETIGADPVQVIGKPHPELTRETGMLEVLETGLPQIDHIRRVAGKDVVISSQAVLTEERIQAVVCTFKLASRIENIDRRLKERLYAKGFTARYTLRQIIGASPAMLRLKSNAVLYAKTDASVLILGETGTGKELLAQAIHNESQRSGKRFVAVNCSALPESLLESELFGYEEGAFTGARRGGKAGLFEIANEGTLFLDEIADITPSLQVRLLRVLEEKVIMRLGGDRNIPVDVRILSSTSMDLAAEIRCGHFRSDLYYRLSVLRCTLPSLRQRTEDIPIITSELFRKSGTLQARTQELLTPEIVEMLKTYSWPGNIRELDSLVRRYIALAEQTDKVKPGLFRELLNEIQGEDLCRPCSWTQPPEQSAPPGSSPISALPIGPLRSVVEQFEQKAIRRALQEAGFNRKAAARSLGISVNTLWRKLKQQDEKLT
jgi:propionate catabolism operon transcriptional regulator